MKSLAALMPILADLAKKGELTKALSALITLGAILEPMLADPTEFEKIIAFLESLGMQAVQKNDGLKK